MTKPQAVIIQSIKTAFGGVSKKNAPHRLTITRETGESWLSTILPETHIRTDAFNVLSVPAELIWRILATLSKRKCTKRMKIGPV